MVDNGIVLKDWKNCVNMKNAVSSKNFDIPESNEYFGLKYNDDNVTGKFNSLFQNKPTLLKSSKTNGTKISNQDLRAYLNNLDSKIHRNIDISDVNKPIELNIESKQMKEKIFNQNPKVRSVDIDFHDTLNIPQEIFCTNCEDFFLESKLDSHINYCNKLPPHLTDKEKLNYYNEKLKLIESKITTFISKYADFINKSNVSSSLEINHELTNAYINNNCISKLKQNIRKIDILISNTVKKNEILSILSYSNASINFIFDKIDCIKCLGQFTDFDQTEIRTELKEKFDRIILLNFKEDFNQIVLEVMKNRVSSLNWDELIKEKLNFH